MSLSPRDYPILEYDPQASAIIEPSRVIHERGAPEHCVLCFFQDVIQALTQRDDCTLFAMGGSELGEHPIYEVRFDSRRLAVLHPGIGAPFAAAMLEEAIARGSTKFVACGGAGVLNPDLAVGSVLVPTSAVRDEGTSYHYLPPSREVGAHPDAVAAIEQTLAARGVRYQTVKTWTTDAFYRETTDKIAMRRDEGCLTVEMEAAAFFAVAQHRGVVLGQMLYGGDDVSGDLWDSREWNARATVREGLFWLAAEACLAL
ncbi:purine-nucleoside phosphorylase [Candidatus Poribacteria bacterium]|nr:purine-nucleoside phosphorylase [Candidatus Poribacteria bacterium]